MKQSLILFSLLLSNFIVKADLPGTAYQYDLYSQDSAYYIKSIPFSEHDQTHNGKTILYERLSGKAIDTIPRYFPRPCFLSNDGKTIISVAYWLWGRKWDNKPGPKFDTQAAVEIYINGDSARFYYVREIVKDLMKLEFSTSHTFWYDKTFIDRDTFFIMAKDQRVVKIAVATGAPAGNMPLGDFLKYYNPKKAPKLKEVVYTDIKYPQGFIFPDLASGEKFHAAFIRAMDKQEVSSYDSSVFYVQMYASIDRQGKITIDYLDAKNRKDKDKTSEWVADITAWLEKQTFETHLIPKNCDRWMFKEFFQLR